MSRYKAIIGTAAMAVGNVVKLAAQLAILPVLARILGPDDYGLVALASPFIFFLFLFADLGLGAALVRTPNVSHEQESAVFWLGIAIAVLLFSITAAAAYPLSHLFHKPEIAPIFIGFALVFFLAAGASVPATRLQREGRFVTVASMELIASLVSMAAAIAAALAGLGAWSLIIQQVVLWIAKNAVLYAATRFRPLFVFRFGLIRPFLVFGAGLLGAQLASFFATNLDNLLVGAVIGTTALGYYAISYQIVNIPPTIFGAFYYSVFPAIAETTHKGQSPEKTYLDVLRVMIMIAAPALIGLALTADLAIELIFGEAWLPAVPLIQLLAVGGVVNCTFVLNGALLLGIGRADIELKTTLIRLSTLTIGILLGLLFGAKGVAGGVCLAIIVSNLISYRYVVTIAHISLTGLLEAIKGPALATMALAVAVLVTRLGLPVAWPMSAKLVACVASGMIAYTSALFWLFQEKFQEDVVLVKSLLLKKGA